MKTRLVFTISPGRCGTAYLCQLLRCVPDAWVGHEPEPDFVNCAYAAQWLPVVARRFWEEVKLPAIDRTGWPIYIETSHLFANGFYESLAQLRPFDVIFLRRDLREVALSFWRRESIPARTERGFLYLINPGGPVMRPVDDWRTLTDYQLCYWYCLEVEERMAGYKRMAGRRYIDIETADLNQRDGLGRIVEALELPAPDWDLVDKLLGQRLNENPSEYQARMPEGDLDVLEREVRERIRV